jgi:glycosyltransferase involved in cell wall biosynthesis
VPQRNVDVTSVVFGPEIWAAQTNGGISRYFVELANNLNTLFSGGVAIIPQHSNMQVSNIQRRIGLTNLKEDLFSIAESSKSEKKIYHATYYDNKNLQLAKSLGFKTVITVFDLISEIYPERPPRFRFVPNLKRKSIQSAEGIICISESTRSDLLRIYEVDPKKIKVIHLASSFNIQSIEELGNQRKNNILYVGKRAGYKNFLVLLTAFRESQFLRNNFRLIAFGGGDFDDHENKLISEFGLNDKVIQLSGDDNVLRDLYSSSRALVYPSLYEGFGLPPLEAMALGCPVITSNVSSMPEICGDAVFYFDPSDVQALRNLLEKTLANEKTLERARIIGLARAIEFSWQKTASQTLDFYNNL